MILCDICNKELDLKNAEFSCQKLVFDTEKKGFEIANPYLHHMDCFEKLDDSLKENRLYHNIDKIVKDSDKGQFVLEFHKLLFFKWYNFNAHKTNIKQVLEKICKLLSYSMYNLNILYKDKPSKVLFVGIDWGLYLAWDKKDAYTNIINGLPASILGNMVSYKFIEYFTNKIDYKEDKYCGN